MAGINDSTSGNVLGNGNIEIVVGFNGSSGLILFDQKGKKIWQKTDGNVWHVEVPETREEILHSNADGELRVRNANGEVVRRYLPGYYVSNFTLTRWGDEAKAGHILVPSSDSAQGQNKPVVFVLDATGVPVSRFDAPFGDLMEAAAGVPLHYSNGLRYYALLQNKETWERSALVVYGEDQKIVYEEIIGDSCSSIATLPGNLGDRLLVGCSEKVWEYSPLPGRLQRPSAPANSNRASYAPQSISRR